MTKKNEIKSKISAMNKSQKLYETKRALKKGFNSLEEYIKSKLVKSEQTQKLDRVSIERKFWKKTVKVDTKDQYGVVRKKSLTIPYFDGNYWTQRNPKYKKGVSTDTSKEMMAHFLKWINHHELEDFKHGNEEGVLGTNYLFIAWSKLIGDGCNEEGIQKNLEKIFIEPFKWFNELEHLITRHSIFWGLIEEIWTYGSHFIDAEKVFSRYGRNKVPLAKRQFWLGYKSKVQLPSTGEAINIKGSGNKPWELMLAEMKSLKVDMAVSGEDKEFIPIYRAFKVKQGKAIRKGVTKFSNGKWNTQQEEGASWSYSTDRFNASTLGWNISTHHFKKYCGMNDNEASKHIVKKQFVTKDQFKHDPTCKEGYYTALGLYLVEEKDILFFTGSRGENEVVVDPSKVRLIDYHMMDITDHISVKLLLNMVERVEANKQDFDLERGNIYNLQSYYDLVRIVVKDYCKKEPTAVSKLLKNGFNQRNAEPFIEHFHKLTGYHLYNDRAFGIYSFKSYDGLTYNIASLLMNKGVGEFQEGKRTRSDKHNNCFVPIVSSSFMNACRPKSMKNVRWEHEDAMRLAA